MFEFEIKKKLPSIYKGILEFQEIADIEESLFSDTVQKGDNFIANNYIFTMLKPGLDRMEAFLDVVTSAGTTVEERRQNLFNIWNSFLPLTYGYLIQSLDRIIGKNNYTVYPKFNEYIITIVVTDGDVNSVVSLCELCMPMNLDWTVYYEIPRIFTTTEYIYGGYIRSIVKSYEVSYSRDTVFIPGKQYLSHIYTKNKVKVFN